MSHNKGAENTVDGKGSAQVEIVMIKTDDETELTLRKKKKR